MHVSTKSPKQTVYEWGSKRRTIKKTNKTKRRYICVALCHIHWYHSKISNHVINSLWCLQRIKHTGSHSYGIGPLEIDIEWAIYKYIQQACGWPFFALHSSCNHHQIWIFIDTTHMFHPHHWHRCCRYAEPISIGYSVQRGTKWIQSGRKLLSILERKSIILIVRSILLWIIDET